MVPVQTVPNERIGAPVVSSRPFASLTCMPPNAPEDAEQDHRDSLPVGIGQNSGYAGAPARRSRSRRRGDARGLRCRSGDVAADRHSGQAASLADFNRTLQGHRRDAPAGALRRSTERSCAAYIEARVDEAPRGRGDGGRSSSSHLHLLPSRSATGGTGCAHPA